MVNRIFTLVIGMMVLFFSPITFSQEALEINTAQAVINKITSNALRIDSLQREIRESNKIAESGIWPTRAFYQNHQIIIKYYQQEINDRMAENHSLTDRLELKI